MSANKGFTVIEVLVAIVIVAIIGSGGYLLWQKYYPSSALLSYIAPTPTPKQTVETVKVVDDKTQKYTNSSLGFSITFPRYETSSGSTCADLKNVNSSEVGMKLFSDPANQKLYFADTVWADLPSKKMADGGYEGDMSACQDKTTTLDGIKLGQAIDSSASLDGPRYPRAFKVSYIKASSESDLATFVDGEFSGWKVGAKQPTIDMPGVDTVKMVPPADFMTGFEYTFYYNEKTKVAVLTQGYQDAAFNGTNGQDLPTISFP